MTTAQATAGNASAASQKLTLVPLIALVVGSMIGGGVFNLPSDMSRGASPGAILIGWIITGIGMLMLAFVYQSLAVRKPELNAGPYAYAKAGFGDFVGFNSRLGLLAERLPRQCRLRGRDLLGAVLFLSGLWRRQQSPLDHRRLAFVCGSSTRWSCRASRRRPSSTSSRRSPSSCRCSCSS